MYGRLVEERDRRLAELRVQLSEAEHQLAEGRAKTLQMQQSLDEQWEAEIQRIRQMHDSSVARLVQQHESDLQRMNQLQTKQAQQQEERDRQHVERLQDMNRKWQATADRLQQLLQQQTERTSDREEQDRQAGDDRWTKWSEELARQRDHDRQLRQWLEDKCSAHVLQMQSDQQTLLRDRQRLESDRNELRVERSEWELQVANKKERFERDRARVTVLEEELDHQREEIRNREQRLHDTERRLADSERQSLELQRVQSERIEQRLGDLSDELFKVKQKSEQLLATQQRLHSQKLTFDKERNALSDLGDSLQRRAEQVQSMHDQALQQKEANETLLRDLEQIRLQVDERLRVIELQANDLKRRELWLQRQCDLVHQEWRDVHEMRQHIRCSLCATSLKHGISQYTECEI